MEVIEPSRISAVVGEARTGLDKDGGLPSAHALEFVSARLMEAGKALMADAIDDALLKHGIAPQSVQHLLFTFSGNDPAGHLCGLQRGLAGLAGLYGVANDLPGCRLGGVSVER